MKRSQSLLVLFVTFLIFPAVAHAQAWSGIISPERATDWTRAGVVGGIPSASWTQCGSTIAAYSGTAATINNAIAACGTNRYVLLGPGTFKLSTGILHQQSNAVLRGSGANSTFLVFGPGAINACGGFGGIICMSSPADSTYYVGTGTVYNWTAGYSQGTTNVTLSGTAGIKTNSTVLILNQCDDGKSGVLCIGTSVDNGNFFNCSDEYSVGTSCSVNGPDTGNVTANRSQSEMFQVTGINGNVVTLSHPLRNPNWASARSPQAWFYQPLVLAGIENLSIDASSVSATPWAIKLFNTANCWVKGVRVVNAPRGAFSALDSTHFTFEQNYAFQAQTTNSSDAFAFQFTQVSDGLVQNNIGQQIRYMVFDEGANNGTVFGYNFFILLDDNSDGLTQSFRPHAGGDTFELLEGNIAVNYYGEVYHGTHMMNTLYRNLLTGWESCAATSFCGGATAKSTYTVPFYLDSYNRYINAVGNVLGTPGFHTTYENTSQFAGHNIIYAIGIGNPNLTVVPNDPVVKATLLRWANYDVVTGAVRFCGNSSNTGWSALCSSASEVPTGAPLYPNSVPILGDTSAGQGALPASLYLSSKPSWFGSLPWPPIGPDVSSGNVGQCAGSLNVSGKFNGVAATNASQCAGSGLSTAWAGHVNANPAMNCALNIMGMPPDGSGNVLAFDASACYGGSSSSKAPNPPTSLVVVVN